LSSSRSTALIGGPNDETIVETDGEVAEKQTTIKELLSTAASKPGVKSAAKTSHPNQPL
jgi:hypothetical protein